MLVSIENSGRGLVGFTPSANGLGSPPESLQRIAQYLNNSGCTTDICEGSTHTLSPHRAVLSTITGWLLTWSRTTRNGLAVYGRLWVAAGAANEIPFTTASD